MRWPSTRFFQAIGLAGFSMSIYNTIAAAAQRRGNMRNIETIQAIGKDVTEISDNIERMAEYYARGDSELKQQIIQDMHNKLANRINSTFNPLQDRLDVMNQSIVDYLRIQEEIKVKLNKGQFLTDPLAKHQLQNEIANLQAQADGKIVQIHDTVSSINPNIYVAKNHVLEAIEQLRRSGNNFMDSFYKHIEDFNNWMLGLDYAHNLAIVNLFGIFITLISLISIVFIFYGNKILDYLNLERRYPKIAKIIVLRRKFQQYYLFWNISIIFIVSMIMFLMNLILFL